MRLSFIPSSRKLAGWFPCMALALAASTCLEARGALTMPTDPNSPQALTRWLASGVTVDWNTECTVRESVRVQDVEQPKLPSFTTDDLQADDAGPAADEDVATNNESADMSEGDASEDSDYLRYKYGSHFGNQFNENSEAESDGASANTEKSAGTDDSTMTDELAESGDSTDADEPATTDEVAKADDSADTDDSLYSDGSKSGDISNPGNPDTLADQDEPQSDSQGSDEMMAERESAPVNDEASDDSDRSSSIEKYYGYRSESLEERVGRNAADDAQKEQGTDSARKDGPKSNDDDTQSMGSERPADDVASERGDSTGTTMTDALLAIVSGWTEEFSTQYGLNIPRLARILDWNW